MARELRQLPETGFLRLRQIIGDPGKPDADPPIPPTPPIIPVSRSSWWQGVRDGRYPPPVKLGPRTTAWTAESIRALIADRRGATASGAA
ncbi:MAG: AlpA family phage regulatory protein [Deltaproteobacteria bacterium]|nr:AlpA family phage regulatory protein [Deltaproteobacteria bacterium]